MKRIDDAVSIKIIILLSITLWSADTFELVA